MPRVPPGSDRNDRDRLQYVIELIEFRSALRQGRRDSEWAGDPRHPSRRLIYVFDTNLAYLFFQPTLETATTRALKMIRSKTDKWIAIITSQFLFDGALPGRGDYPIFLDPLHQSEEFAGKIVETRDKLLDRARNASGENTEELAAAIRRIQSDILRNEHDIGKLKKLFEGGFRELFERFNIGEAAAPWLMRDLLLERDLLRPLRLGPFLRGCDIEALDDRQVEIWEKHLWHLSVEPEKRSENIRRDAKCLARLQHINAHIRAMGAQVRYVLVTADRAIIEAARLHHDIVDPADPGPLVRDVLQYIPIGNIRDLDNSVTTSRGTKAIERAIDVLFAVEDLEPSDRAKRMDQLLSLARGLRARLDSLDTITETDRKKRAMREAAALMDWFINQNLQASLTETRADVERRWSQLLKNSVNLNQRHILTHYSKWLGELLDSLDNVAPSMRRKIGSDYESAQLKLAQQLTRAHIFIVLNTALSANLSYAHAWSRLGLGVRLDGKKVPSAAGRKASEIVSIVSSGEIDKLHDALSDFCHTRQTLEEVTLAGAALALQCGLWNVAAELSRQSHSEMRKDTTQRSLLRRARAVLISALAYRGKLMSSDETLSAATPHQDTIRSTIDSLEEAAGTFEQVGYELEAGLAHAEMAWCRVLLLLAAPKTADVEQISEDLILSVGYCMDCVADNSGQDVRDFTGGRIADIAEARGAAALVLFILHELQMGRSIPFTGRTMLGRAAQSLDRFGREGVGRLRQEGTWWLLSEIADSLNSTDTRGEIQLPPSILESINNLRTSDLPYFTREISVIENAAKTLLDPMFDKKGR